MPKGVQKMIDERIEEKSEERKVKEEMRKLAEEEILKELRMAEEFFKRNQFEQTQKGYNFNDEEKDDDCDVEERETSPPIVSGAPDDGDDNDDPEPDFQRESDPSPKKEEMTWEEMLRRQ